MDKFVKTSIMCQYVYKIKLKGIQQLNLVG